ncbi:uncharacterized protein LOC143080987 [Mytilus galloprovincialis]|uniref:uncharacterized protein LOC143080987 n=1 Tax=Mytilus galloprovincialis TaxID=29158 RepID=UPI003F7BF74E
MNYGDGVNYRTFEAIKRNIHDLIWATKKPKVEPFSFLWLFPSRRTRTKSTDADKYLAAILGVCSKQQRQELMKVKNKRYYDHVPLSLACKIRNLDLVKFLVEYCDADVNGNDGDGKPMLWAIAKQEEHIVHYLLQHSADPGKNIAPTFNLLLFSMKIRSSTATWPSFGYEENYDEDDEKESYNEDSDDDNEDEDDEDDTEGDDDDDESQDGQGDEGDWTDVDDDESDYMSDDEDEFLDEEESMYGSDDEVECRIRLDFKNKKDEKIPVPCDPKLRIVVLLIAYGAVEKCSENQLFDIFRAVLPEESTNVIVMNSGGRLYEACLPIFLDKVPNLANVRNAEGMSLLGYELLHKDYNYKRCQISSYIEPILEQSDGTEVNTANVLKYYYIPMLEDQPDTIETNVNTVLKSCRINPTTNNVTCDDDSNPNKYVHALIFLAATGKSLLGTCLDMPKIPFHVKFDTLEIAGANFAKWGCFSDAVDCWNAANCIRQQIVTLKNKNSEQEYVSKWEKDIEILDELAEELQNPYEDYTDMDTVYIDFDEDSRSIIESVEESFKTKLNTGTVPDIVVHSPMKSVVSHLYSLTSRERRSDNVSSDSEDEEEQLHKTRIAILTKSVLIHERLIGYGCHQTMRAFHALAIEYKRHDKVQEFVTVMTYSFPYLVKYIPQEEYYAVSSITKTYTLTKFIDSFTNVLLTETKRGQLSFDLLMAICKCLFLNCLATPRKQRDFSQFAPLLLAIKCLHRYEKTDEEDRRFLQFLRKVLKDDIRNDVRQSLLHYVTPVTNKASDKLEKEVSGSLELVEVLLSSGADPNTADEFGMTPLHLAYRVRSTELNEVVNEHHDNQMNIIQALLGGGAHTDCVDAANRTPIWYSQTSSSPLCPVGTRSLQCLASAVIVNSGVPYQGNLSSHMVKYVDIHKKRGKLTTDIFLVNLLNNSQRGPKFFQMF